MTDPLLPAEAARLLRQRLEMGGDRIVLGGMTRAEALALIAASPRPGARAAAPASASETPARNAGRPVIEERVVRPGPVPSMDRPASKRKDESRSVPEKATPLVLPDDYDALKEVALGCTACALCESRTQVVFSDGPSDARLMVVGEAPGANEDESGIPFVGAAGKYLDLLLSMVDLSREDSVYIANVLKCRPPGNRNPLPEEIETCSPILLKQIDLVRPKALLAVGSFSGKLLTGQEKSALGKIRGKVHSYHGVPLVVTYHPAALLRNGKWTRLFWEDLQLLRGVLDEA